MELLYIYCINVLSHYNGIEIIIQVNLGQYEFQTNITQLPCKKTLYFKGTESAVNLQHLYTKTGRTLI